MTTKVKALIGLGVTVILFSFVVIVSRISVSSIPQLTLMFFRMLVASVAFLPFFIKSKVWKKEKFKQLLLISTLSTINVLFFMWGIKYTTASASQLIYAAQPILTIIFSSLLWNEKYQKRTISGVVVGLIGIFLIIASSAVEKGETISGGIIGNLAMIVAMSGWLFYILLSKKLSKYFDVLEIGSTSILVSLFFSFVFMILQLRIENQSVIFSKNLLYVSLYLGLFGTFATYILMQYAIKYLSPLTVNMTSYIQPITTTLLAIILLGEKLTPTFLLGGLLVFLGVFTSATLEFYHSRRK